MRSHRQVNDRIHPNAIAFKTEDKQEAEMTLEHIFEGLVLSKLPID
jgi:hypothetical protein